MALARLRWLLALPLALLLGGCVSTLVGAAATVTVEVIKLPFTIGGAVIDAVSDDDDDEPEDKD